MYETIIIENASNANALFYAGLSYYHLNDVIKSGRYLDKILSNKMDVHYEEAKWYKALILIKQGKEPEAKKLLQELINSGGAFKIRAQEKM